MYRVCRVREHRQDGARNSRKNENPAAKRGFHFASRRLGILFAEVSSPRSHALLLFERNVNDAGPHHAKRARRTERKIDHPAPHEGATIVDAALN